MENIIEILIKIAGVVVALILSYLGNKAAQYIKARISAEDWARLETFVSSLVAAAEQLFKEDDEDGKIRLAYVENMLAEAGYELTDALRALIESKVYELNIVSKELMLYGSND